MVRRMANVIEQIWRYPAKSMQGEQLEATALNANGLPGDRGWACRSEEIGGIRGARKLGNLMKLASRTLPNGDVEISLPDGSSFLATDADAGDRISAAIGHRITWWPILPSTDLDHYRRGPNGENIAAEFSEMFDVAAGEAFPDFSKFPPILAEFESPPGTYFDAYPLLVVTASSLRELQTLAPDSTIDVRRFRPNIVVDTGDETGMPELEWQGREARLGGAIVRFTIECPRCVMTTREFADLPQDRGIMRALAANTKRCFGMYAEVASPGRIALGDQLVWQ